MPLATDVTAQTGQGVTGLIAGVRYWLGSPDYVFTWLGQVPAPEAMSAFEAAGGSIVALGREGEWLALFRLADIPRIEASQLCAKLAEEGVGMSMLSGDTSTVVSALALTLGIPDAHGAMSPEGKQAYIAELQRSPQAVVAMVGDGVNDAPVLAQAHVSIAMGGGTDLARNQADIVLLSENLAGLGRGMDLSLRTLRIIRQNLWWSFAYNFTSVPLAMAGLVTPWMAGIGMAASSLFVVLNALRLQRQPPVG
jgi:Cu2+-exporting ATPase